MNQRVTAAKALTSVQSMRQSAQKAKFKTLCMRAPSILRRSGLAQTLVFLASRERQTKTGLKFCDYVAETMGIENQDVLRNKALRQATELGEYMHLTARAETAMLWIRKMAQIEMVDIEEEDLDASDQ